MRHTEKKSDKRFYQIKGMSTCNKDPQKGNKVHGRTLSVSDTLFTRATDKEFVIKSKYKASMKRKYHSQSVSSDLQSVKY